MTTKTKQKAGRISMGIMLRHMDKPKAQKPETLWARFEVLDKEESFEGRKLYSLRFSDIGYCYFIRVYADQLDALRATQPKTYEEGIAQGRIMGLKEAFNKRPFSSDEEGRIGYGTWLVHEIRKVEPNFHKLMPQEAQKQVKG